MTHYLNITPPDKLLDQWDEQLSRIQTPRVGYQDPAVTEAAKRDFFTKIARWGAREISETPKQKLQRLINKTGNEELIEAFNQLEES